MLIRVIRAIRGWSSVPIRAIREIRGSLQKDLRVPQRSSSFVLWGTPWGTS